jgi:hypothetical protein
LRLPKDAPAFRRAEAVISNRAWSRDVRDSSRLLFDKLSSTTPAAVRSNAESGIGGLADRKNIRQRGGPTFTLTPGVSAVLMSVWFFTASMPEAVRRSSSGPSPGFTQRQRCLRRFGVGD